jgi:hypothetical protein
MTNELYLLSQKGGLAVSHNSLKKIVSPQWAADTLSVATINIA